MIKSLDCIEHDYEDFSLQDEEIAFLEALVEGVNFEENEENLFDFSQLDPFDIKKEIIADHIKSLVHHIGKTHTELCNELGWKKSRFSKVISGKANLTLKTIFEISVATGYDFDVVFNNKHKKLCHQPWHESNKDLEVFFEDFSTKKQLPKVDYIEPCKIDEYMNTVDVSEVNCLLAFRTERPKLKDVYEDQKIIESSFYSITTMKNRYSEDDYFDYKIPEKIVVQR